MRKILFFAAALLTVTAANAKVWRINYDENANADFRTIAAACSSSKVANTDTLYCEAGYQNGSDADNTISRSGIKVFGPGWGFETVYGGTTTIADARFTNEFIIKASNVLISGLVCENNLRTSDQVRIKNVTIERCQINRIYASARDTLSDLTIKDCSIQSINLSVNGLGIKNIYITNNLIVSKNQYGYNQAIICKDDQKKISNVNILRNTIVYGPYNDGDWYELPVYIKNSLIQDNIIINTNNPSKTIDFTPSFGNIVRKNVLSLDGNAVESADIIANFPDNYYVGATEASTFTCTNSTYRSEQYFQLKEGSPAKGVAYDGGDCGAFGGSTPYIICGRPQGIPYITDVEVPAQPKNNKLTVTFKVANQNE